MFKPTVAKIVAGFQKTIDQLESLSKASALEVELYNKALLDIEEKRAAADMESARAKMVANKIQMLIGPDPEDGYEFPSDEELLEAKEEEVV